MSFTVRNHYVPEWYQRLFMYKGQRKLFYLDLCPEKVLHENGGHHYRNALRRLGPSSCFKDDHLYTLQFGEKASDIVEKRFFGPIDDLGAKAVKFFCDYKFDAEHNPDLRGFMNYMDAQKIRTPKGLAFLQTLGSTLNHQFTLEVMGRLWRAHCTMWGEGVWEVISCDESETKFIVSDHPVTTYNKGLFPGVKECLYPSDAPIDRLGTHTVFPLSINRCLIITNLGCVRNPKVNPKKIRVNPRYSGTHVFDLRSVQRGRQVSDEYVTAINFVLKDRARKYIAAAEEEWLYPERSMKTTMWNKIGGKLFLMPDPRKVSFSRQVVFGYEGGRAWGQDEYGRIPNDVDPAVKQLRDRESRTFFDSQKEWDKLYGRLSADELKLYFM
jgi:Protein of unknown function (DUF4238)